MPTSQTGRYAAALPNWSNGSPLPRRKSPEVASDACNVVGTPPTERRTMRSQFSLAALALGNFVVGLSILAPAGMMPELALGFDVTIGAVGLLISLGAAVVCLSPPLVAWATSSVDRRSL